jgi:hypothetical protein
MAFLKGIEDLVKAFTGEKSIKSEAVLKDGKFAKDVVPSFMDGAEISTKTISDAARKATKFFGLPEIPIKEGPSVAVAPGNFMTFRDDVFLYNKAQLKREGLTTSADIAKVYAHECGHRISQRFFNGQGSWANELCADFFAGAFCEINNMKAGNFERSLSRQRASVTHPGGKLRMQALEYGRRCVADMKAKGITPTWENLMEKFKETNAHQITFANYRTQPMSGTVLGFSSTYHLKDAAYEQKKYNAAMSRVEKDIKRGDLKSAVNDKYWADVHKRHMDSAVSRAKTAIKNKK